MLKRSSVWAALVLVSALRKLLQEFEINIKINATPKSTDNESKPG